MRKTIGLPCPRRNNIYGAMAAAVWLFAAVINNNHACGDGVPKYHDLETQFLKSRSRINEGLVILNTEIKDFSDEDNSGKITYSSIRHVAFSADGQWRCDTTYLSGDLRLTTASLKEEKLCVTRCLDNGQLRFVQFLTVGDRAIPVRMSGFKDMKSLMAVDRIVDPRRLGLIAIDSVNLPQFDLGSIYGRADYVDELVETAETDGVPCWKASLHRQNGVAVTIYCAKEMGNNVIRVETDWQVIGHRHQQTVHSKLQKLESIDDWYPKSCHFEERIDTKLVTTDDTIVDSAILNKPIPKSKFSLEDMSIPVGTRIYNLENKSKPPQGVWDGHQIREAGK